jgi:hypothetical protein
VDRFLPITGWEVLVSMAECKKLPECGFHLKYGSSRDIICKGFTRMYCRGPKMDDCVRMKYFAEHGEAPPDEMAPNGHILTFFA